MSLTALGRIEAHRGASRRIEAHFHTVILGRVHDLVYQERLRLPELVPLLELRVPRMYFSVPGMYGGFDFRLLVGAEPKLISESWCRIVGGSGERHEITPRGIELVAQGFV